MNKVLILPKEYKEIEEEIVQFLNRLKRKYKMGRKELLAALRFLIKYVNY